jgi:ATP-binding cassette, subfamily B, bacterial
MQTVTKDTIRSYWEHTKIYKWTFLVLALTVVSSAVINVTIPVLFKRLVNILHQGDTGNLRPALDVVWLIFYVEMVRQVIYRTMGYVVNYCQPAVMSDLLNTCYEYLVAHSYGFFTSNFVGSIVTRTRRYSASYERVSDVILFELSQTILGIMLILVMMFSVHLYLGLVTLAWVVVFAAFIYIVTRYKMKTDLAVAKQDTKITAHLADTFTNSINLKLFSSAQEEIHGFAKHTENIRKLRKRAWDITNHANVFQGGAMVLLRLAVLTQSVRYYYNGVITAGDVVMLDAFMGQIFDRLWDFSRSIKNIYEGFADANEMTQMLTRPHEVIDEPGCKTLDVTEGKVSFNNVCFRYGKESRNVVEAFNLHVRPGEKVGLVGRSGAGKTTLIALLLRFKDIQAGEIVIDGQDISGVCQKSLRDAISVVPQDAVLFHRSLLENIRYGRPMATDEDVIESAKAAHAHEFIMNFPDGYNTLVGERGMRLSGGQRQRVAIARAILKNSPLLILDEATSSLDSESEEHIQEAMKTLMAGKTVIVIAHRLATIKMMDRIVVLEGGVILEEGTHAELLEGNGVYRRYYQRQITSLVGSSV